MKLLTAFILFLLPSLSLATEPNHCTIAYLHQHELSSPSKALERLHLYNFSNHHLAGLAVGDSDTSATKSLALSLDTLDKKYCTFYFNDGNQLAAELFHYQPIKTNPIFSSSPKEFEQKVLPLLPQMIGCLDEGYLALGCDGMKHRGPSVFSMLLSVSGCSPERSADLVEYLWSKNFVSHETRVGIARVGFEYGNTHPAIRQTLQRIFKSQ